MLAFEGFGMQLLKAPFVAIVDSSVSWGDERDVGGR